MTPHTLTVPTLPGITEEEATYVATDLSRFKREAIEFALVRIRSLQSTGKHRYRGTVTPKVKATRRQRDRFAAASRKANR